MVIEGYLGPEKPESRAAGDHTGFLFSCRTLPCFSCYMHNSQKRHDIPCNACWKASHGRLLHGKSNRADISTAVERLDLPEIKDINLPMEGVFHNFAIISIKKSYPGHAKKNNTRHMGKRADDVCKALDCCG